MAKPPTKYLSEYHLSIQNIRAKAAIYPDRLIKSRFYVPKDETGEPIKFEFRYPQKVAYEIYREEKRSGRPIRLWFLKARRVGLTSLFAALETANSWAMDNRRVGIIAHNDERARRILQMCKFYYKRLPAFMQLPLNKDATTGLKYAQHDSELVIGTCTKPEKVRGDGLHEAHLSEAAYYGNNFQKVLGEISTTIAPAAGTSIVIETTGKARGSAAHRHYEASKKGQTVYKVHFLPWHEDPTCVMPFNDDKHRALILGNMQDVEPRLVEKLTFWDRKLKAEGWKDPYTGIVKPRPDGITPEKFFWAYWQYLYRTDQNYEYFCQEFPMDDEEAWSAEGSSFFGENEISRLQFTDDYWAYGFNGRFINQPFNSFDKLELLSKITDDDRSEPYIKVWKQPTPGRMYVIAADSSLGEAKSTFTAGYVIDMVTREMMAMYHGRVRPDEHAWIMSSLGIIYNNALVAPEINPGGGGMSILTDLQRIGYYNIYIWRKRDRLEGMRLVNSLGWVTNNWSRPLILSELRKMVQDCSKARFADPGMFKDKALITEMRSFHVNPDNGRPEAALDSYDDRILALAIAHRVAGDETLGGKQDLYMRYDNEGRTHPLIEMADKIMAQEDSEDAALPVVNMFKKKDMEIDEDGVTFY